MRGKQKRAQAALDRGLTGAARRAPFERPPGWTGGPPVDARARIEVVRVPVGPVCRWCGTPIDVSQRGRFASDQVRCGCGLP